MRNRTNNQITFAFIRHGTTYFNREHRYLGKTDPGLDEKGKKELLRYKEEKKYPNIDLLFVSPMKRCKETADLLYPSLEQNEIANWTEMDFGEFEGKNYQELCHDPRYQKWIDSGGTLAFPEGESREAFILRTLSGFYEAAEKIRTQFSDKTSVTIGCIVHGGTIMALLSEFLGGDYFDYQIPNGGVYMWIPSGSDYWRSALAATSDSAHRKSDCENGTIS